METWSRPELRRLVPAGARRILDVGCGDGLLGARLKDGRPDRTVWGCEQHPARAARARARLDRLFEQDATTLELAPASLDLLIYADVLEHLPDPWALLARQRAWLRPGGAALASVPNVQHHAALRALLCGRWEYADFGLFDRGHLRFFTRRSITALFAGAGYRITRLERGWGRAARLVSALAAHLPADFLTFQFFVAAVPVGA